MKRILNLVACASVIALFFPGKVKAQQDPMYSQYMFNQLSVNPAYAGVRDILTMTALYRKQWVGVSGAPTTLTLSADTPMKNQKMALGFNLVSDKIGISKTMVINVAYAYRLMFSNGGLLHLGLQGGINQYRADYSSVNTAYDNSGPADVAFAQSTSSIFPNFGFGAYYYTGRFFVGAAVPKMLKNNLAGTNSPTIDFTSYPNRQNRHLFITTGYTFDLNQDWDLRPSMLIKGVHGAPLEMDLNVNAWWKSKVGAGLSYRSADAVVVMLQFQAKDELNFGYAYDMTLSKFSGTNSGSHELMLRYEPHAKDALKGRARLVNRKTSYNKPKKNNLRKKASYKKRKKNIRRRRIGKISG
jgi:type IX secretion system PorP/SprF family membrane protein